MKKILLSITAALIMLAVPAAARSYDDISEYALFLTDKMAYELNLTEEQYEAAYEINFDYLYDVLRYGDYDDFDDYDDLYGRAWKSRNRDLRIILLSSQYNMYRSLQYFYRPFHRSHGRIVIQIYNYYPQRDYLYFGCPNFVISYRGGHGWRHYRHHSYYSGRAWNTGKCYGMRDGYHRGHRYYHDRSYSSRRYNEVHVNSRHHDVHNGHRYRDNRDCHDGFRNSTHHGRVSSTRTTVNNRSNGTDRSRGNIDRGQRLPDNRFSPRNNRSNNNSRRTVSTNDRNRSRQNNNKGNDSERRGRFGGGR